MIGSGDLTYPNKNEESQRLKKLKQSPDDIEKEFSQIGVWKQNDLQINQSSDKKDKQKYSPMVYNKS